MANFHAADLWVAVVPDTSKVGPEMEKAGKDAKDKFGSGVKDIGKTVSDELGKAASKVKGNFAQAGKDAGGALVTGLKSGNLDQAIGDIGTKLGGKLAGDIGASLGSKLGGLAKDYIPGLDGIAKELDKVRNNAEPAGGAVKTVQDALSGVSGALGGFDAKAGGAEGHLGKLASAAGKAAAGLTAIYGAYKLLDTVDWSKLPGIGTLENILNAPEDLGDWLHKHLHLPTLPVDPRYGFKKDQKPTPAPGSTLSPKDYEGMLLGPTNLPPPPEQHYGGAGAGGNLGDLYGPDTGTGIGGAGAAAWSGPAPAAGVPLTQGPGGTVTSPNAAWAHLIQRESGGRNVRQGIIDANSGGNEAEGIFQITPATWRSHGGTQFAPSPLKATPQQQAIVAARILHGNPSGSDWGAGMSGRESASALSAGLSGTSGGGDSGIGAGSPLGGGDGGGGGGDGGGGGGGPIGTQGDPVYVAQTDGGPGGGPGGGGGGLDGGGGGGGPGGAGNQYAEQFGSSLVSGIAEGLGIDGSVFKSFTGKGPMDWGITKLGTGLLNWGLGGFGTGKSLMGGGAGGMPGGGGIGQGILGAVGVNMPGGGAGAPGGGDVHNHYAPQNQTNVTQNGVDDGVQAWQAQQNAAQQPSYAPAMTAPVNP